MQILVLVLSMFLVSCTSFSPVLKPISKGEVTSSKEAINLYVKPVITQGMGSEDKKEWKVDVSAYFTAFEVALVNNTSKSLIFDPQKSYLQIEDRERFAALSREESVEYYKREDAASGFRLLPKSRRQVAEEGDRVRAAGISGGTVAPGQQRRGLLFFKKVAREHCQNVILRLEGIRVAETGQDKDFSFAFACDRSG